MKIWKVLSPGVLAEEEKPESIQSPTQAKVKVTKLLLSSAELRVFDGSAGAAYPVIPGRFAVGVVSEAGEHCVGVEKNTRVYIRDVAPCGRCEQCVAGHAENCVHICVAGVDRDGALRDFVVAEESALSPLPPSVSDDKALFIGIVSMCEAVVDGLNAAKGTHIAVFGADEIGNLLSQLLIYRQAVPILIDPDEDKLKLAAQCGIYYTVKADEALHERISQITGGRMAAGSVYTSYCPVPPETAFETTAAGGTVVYTGLGFPSVSVPMKIAQDKRLTLTTISNDYSNNAAAINLLVNNAVDPTPLIAAHRPVAEAAGAFQDGCAALKESGRAPCGVIEML